MSIICKVPIVSSLIICSIMFLSSCEENPTLPKVITSLSEVAKTTATFVGNVTDDGGAFTELGSTGYYWAIGPFTYNIGVSLYANKSRSYFFAFSGGEDDGAVCPLCKRLGALNSGSVAPGQLSLARGGQGHRFFQSKLSSHF